MARRSVILKRTAIGAGVVLVLLIVLIALLPTLISAGLGHGAIRSAIEDRLTTGSIADFQSLSVSWGGPQEIRGLRIVDPQGEEVANVNASIRPGLWSLLFGTFGVLEANVSDGTINALVHEDGTTNLQQIVKVDPEPRETGPPMQGVPPIVFRASGIDVNVTHMADQRTVSFNDLGGYLTYSPAGEPNSADPSEVSFEFIAQTLADDVKGEVRLAGKSENLFDSDGAFTPEGAPINMTLTASNVPVPGMDMPTVLTQLAMAVHADNLAQLVAADIESEAAFRSPNAQSNQDTAADERSRFRAQINVRMPFRADGSLDVTLESVTAEATGERVPSSLLQPVLASTPIVLARDVGRTIDLDASIDPAQGTAIISAVGERASLDLSAVHDAESGWWSGDNLVLVTQRAHPDLVQAVTNLSVDRPVNVALHMTEFRLPPVDPASESRPLALYGGTGVLRINEPVALLFEPAIDDETQTGTRPGGAPDQDEPAQTILVNRAEIAFDAPALGEHLDIDAALLVDDAPVTLKQRITNLFDEAGEINAVNADFAGNINVDGLPTATIAQWLPNERETLRDLLGEQIDLSVTTSVEEAGLRGAITASGAQTLAEVEVLRRPDALEIAQASAAFALTPAVAQRFMPEPDDPEQEQIALLEDVPARLELDPIVLIGSRPDEYRLQTRDLRGRIILENVALSGLPGAAELVNVQNFNANVTAMLARDPLARTPELDESEQQPPLLAGYSADGSAAIRHYTDGSRIATVRYALNGKPSDNITAEEQREPQLAGTLEISELDVRSVERLVGREPGQFELWLGESGSADITFSAIGDRYEATIVPAMPRLQGTVTATYADDLIDLNTGNATLTLGAEALAQMLGDDARISVERDVPGTFSIDASIPLGLLTQQAFEPTLFDLNAELRGGPLVMHIENERQTVENVVVTVKGDAFSDAAQFEVVIEGDTVETAASAPLPPPGTIGVPRDQSAQQAQPIAGRFTVHGTLHEPIIAGSPLTFENSRVNLDANFNRAPTALADAFLQMQGHLIAVVGPHLDGTLEVDDVMRRPVVGFDAGEIKFDLISPNGFVKGSGVVADGVLHFSNETPITGEVQMTPLMRDFVLSRIHPIFNNLLTAETPLTARFGPASIPLDSDISRLAGTVNLNIGAVSFDRQSPILGILALAGLSGVSSDSAIVQFDPIAIEIQDGIIEYDRFVTHISSIDLPWQGTIDLVQKRVNLRTALPLSQLKIRELQEILGSGEGAIEVPLVLRGPLGAELEPIIDPDFDIARELLRQGIERNLLDRLFRNSGGDTGGSNPLRDLFGPRGG